MTANAALARRWFEEVWNQGQEAMIDEMLNVRKRVGTVLDPYAAYALGRGLKTLAVRVERHNTYDRLQVVLDPVVDFA